MARNPWAEQTSKGLFRKLKMEAQATFQDSFSLASVSVLTYVLPSISLIFSLPHMPYSFNLGIT